MTGTGANDGDNCLAADYPVELAAIEEARLAVGAYLERFDPPAKAVNRLEVILEELLSNVVRHAQGASAMHVAARWTGAAVILRIEDDGAPFDPRAQPENPEFSTLQEARLGGLGLPLVRKLSQVFDYERVDARNRVTVRIAAD